MHGSYAEWLASAQQGERGLVARGQPVERVMVDPDELASWCLIRGRPRPLDPYAPHLEARWREGCRNGWRLWRELQRQSFAGTVNAVARWVARQRREDPPLRAAEVRRAAAWPEPSSRRRARLLTTPPDKLDGHEGVFLGHLAETAPDPAQAGDLASRSRDLPLQRLHQLLCRLKVSDPASFMERRRDLVGQTPVVAGLDLLASLRDPFPTLEDEKTRHQPSRPMGAALQKALIWHVVAPR